MLLKTKHHGKKPYSDSLSCRLALRMIRFEPVLDNVLVSNTARPARTHGGHGAAQEGMFA
jgi:hypothetical protein